MSVVLPAPFGPKRPKISPRATLSETPASAGCAPAAEPTVAVGLRQVAGLDGKRTVHSDLVESFHYDRRRPGDQINETDEQFPFCGFLPVARPEALSSVAAGR